MTTSAAEFVKALHQLGKPTQDTCDFLRAHAIAEFRAATATQLANAARYDGWRGINLRYGILAKEIGDLVGRPNAGLALISSWIEPGKLTNSDYILIMREEFAEALTIAGWI